MNKDPITIQEIEAYLAGELTPEHLAEFEEKLREDKTAQLEVINIKKVIEGIQGSGFKQKLKEFHKRNFPKDGDIVP